MNAPNIDQAAGYCRSFKDPLALAAALLDAGMDLDGALSLATEHGHDVHRLRSAFAGIFATQANGPDLAGSEPSTATEAAPFGNSESNAAANDSQDLAMLDPLGAIHVMRDWTVYTVPSTAAGLAQWCREHHAPDVKPAGTKNAQNLGFLLTLAEDCSGEGHPKKPDVVFTHGCSFDLDKITRADIEETLKRTVDARYAAVFWESHSSTEAEPAGRLLLILDPPCPADAHVQVYEQLRAELCPRAPKGQQNVNRGWNPPRASAELIEIEGTPVNWQDVIARVPKAAKQETKSASATPVTDRARALGLAVMVALQHPVGSEDGKSSTRLLALGSELIHRLGLTLDEAVDVALQYYDPRCTNASGELYPWGEAEIRRGFQSAAARPPREDQLKTREWLAKPSAPVPGTPEHDALMAKNAADQAAEIAGKRPAPDAETLEGLYAQVFRPLAELPAPKPLSYVCEGLLIARDVRPACFVCYPGVGKSTAGVELARAVATGSPAFGQFPCQKGRVLFIANEGGRGAHDALLRQVPPEHRDNIVLVRDTLLLAGPVSETAFALLERAAKEFDLIVLDSLNSSLPGLDENDARSAEPLGRLEKLIAADNGARSSMVVLRHTGKTGAGRKDPMQAGRGTSAIDGRVSVQWLLEPVGDLGVDRSVDWQCTRANDTDRDPARPFNVALRGGKFEVRQETGKQAAAKHEADAKGVRHQNDEQLARAAIQEAWWTGGRRGISQRDAEQIAIAKGLPGRAGRRALEQLVTEGKSPAVRGAEYAYRTTERGPVFWGTNPHDQN